MAYPNFEIKIYNKGHLDKVQGFEFRQGDTITLDYTFIVEDDRNFIERLFQAKLKIKRTFFMHYGDAVEKS